MNLQIFLCDQSQPPLASAAVKCTNGEFSHAADRDHARRLHGGIATLHDFIIHLNKSLSDDRLCLIAGEIDERSDHAVETLGRYGVGNELKAAT